MSYLKPLTRVFLVFLLAGSWSNSALAGTITTISGSQLPDTPEIREQSAKACAATKRVLHVYDRLDAKELEKLQLDHKAFRAAIVDSANVQCSKLMANRTQELLRLYMKPLKEPFTLEDFMDVAKEPPKVISVLDRLIRATAQ
ncbi:MAG: hypothetical protein AAF468_21985 [Pseudomonadota bacterium]